MILTNVKIHFLVNNKIKREIQKLNKIKQITKLIVNWLKN